MSYNGITGDSGSKPVQSFADIDIPPKDRSDRRANEDENLLALGYEPQLKREFSWFSVVSFATSVTAIFPGVMVLFITPLQTGGPASIVWTWFWGSCGCMLIALSVAELVSAYPTDGGLYYTVRHVVPHRYVPIVGWMVGWVNLFGQIASCSSSDFALAEQITALAALVSNYSYNPPNSHIVGVMVACLLVHGTLNSLPTKWLAKLTSTFAIVNVAGCATAIVALLVKCNDKNSAEFVFTQFENNSGWPNDGISFCLGLLNVAWIMTDYDATAHISEEIPNANIRAPVAIVAGIAYTAVVGWILFIVLVICMGTDIDGLINAPSSLPVVLIYLRNLGKAGAIAMLCLTIYMQSAVAMVNIQACARTIFAMARDDMLPCSNVWRTVNSRTRTPVYAVWLLCVVAALLGLLDLASYYAANAIFAVTSVALDWSYAIPILCKVVFASQNSYRPGPLSLGRWSKPINIAAVVWVAFVSIVLCLPEGLPVSAQTMNYTSVVFVAWIFLATAYWFINRAWGRAYLGPGSRCFTERIYELG